MENVWERDHELEGWLSPTGDLQFLKSRTVGGDPMHRTQLRVENLRPLKLIQKGGFGKVYLCKDRESGLLYAVKVVAKSDLC